MLPWIRETRGLSPVSATSWSTKAVFPRPSRFSSRLPRPNQNPTRAALKFLSAGQAHLQRGQNGPAAAAADKALQLSTVTAVRFLAAQIFAATGAIDKAEALAAELSKSTEPSDDARVYGKIIEAQIALKRKDPRQAIKTLTDANSVLDTWVGHFNLGRAYPGGRRVRSSRLRVRRMYHAPWRGP